MYNKRSYRGSTNPRHSQQLILQPIIIHQIFSLARHWSKRVTWPSIPQLKLGNIRKYSPIFGTARVVKNSWRIINTIAFIWLWKHARIFVLGHYLFLEAHSVHLSEQIMSADKYPSILSRQMEAIVYLYLVWYAVWCKITLLSFMWVCEWTLKEIWSFLRHCLQVSRVSTKRVKDNRRLQAKLAGQFQ